MNLKNGERLIHVFERDKIEEIRNRSAAKNSNFWTKDWLAMARKTVIRSHYNGGEVPLSSALMQALEYEQEQERQAEITVVKSEIPEAPTTEVEVGFGDRTNSRCVWVGRTREATDEAKRPNQENAVA